MGYIEATFDVNEFERIYSFWTNKYFKFTKNYYQNLTKMEATLTGESYRLEEGNV